MIFTYTIPHHHSLTEKRTELGTKKTNIQHREDKHTYKAKPKDRCADQLMDPLSSKAEEEEEEKRRRKEEEKKKERRRIRYRMKVWVRVVWDEDGTRC